MSRVQYPQGHVLLRSLSKSFPVISHGEGIYLYDTDGKKYIDASGGAMVTSIGHGRKDVAQEIAEQLSRVAYVNGTQFTSQVMEDFAAKLVELAPEGLDRVAVLGSGSEAIEAGIKFIRQLWVERKKPERAKFIARSPGYHGNTLFALSASARAHYKKFYGPLLHDVIMVPAPYEYRSPVDYATQGAEYYAQKLEDAILAAGPETVAGFIVEPIIGSSAGGSCPPPGYFDRVQAICKKYGVLILADEVLCGSGRTGKFFASEHYNLKPDVLVLGKGINGGMMSMSAVLVKSEQVDEMKKGSGYFMHAQTYLQAPSAAATGLAVLKFFAKEKLLENCTRVGEFFHRELKAELQGHPNVGFITGKGLLAGIEFVQDKATKKPFDRSRGLVEKFLALAFERGLILWSNTGHADGVNGDLIMLAPPLVISQAEAKDLVAQLKTVIEDFFKGVV